MQKWGKDSSQEGEEWEQQAGRDHQPLPLMHSYSVEGDLLSRSLCNVPRGVLTPFPPPLHLPSEPL